MDLEKALVKEHTKRQKDKIAKYVGSDTKRFPELMDLFFKGEYRVTQRAAWVMSYCVQIPKQYQGRVMNACFNFVASNDAAIAIKAFSLTILQNLSKDYPEIRSELKLIIEERWPHETAAFRSRAKKILKDSP
jgi:hypothetical protein